MFSPTSQQDSFFQDNKPPKLNLSLVNNDTSQKHQRPKSCLPTKLNTVGNLVYQSMKQTKKNDLKNLKEANDSIKEDQHDLIQGAGNFQLQPLNVSMDIFEAQDSDDVFLVPEKSFKEKMRIKFIEGKRASSSIGSQPLVLHRFTHLMPKTP